MSSITELFGLGQTTDITWDDLDRIKCGVWINAHTGEICIDDEWTIRYKKIKTKVPNQQLLVTEIKNSDEKDDYPNHRHSDCKETVTALNDKFIINDRVLLLANEQYTFHKGVKHRIKFVGEDIGTLLVEFNR